MAIYQKERHFQSIIRELDVETIPTRFVKDITCYLRDGSVFTLTNDEFCGVDSATDNIENVVKDLEFFNLLADLKIQIDYDKVEKDVIVLVEQMLGPKTDNDQSNTSV